MKRWASRSNPIDDYLLNDRAIPIQIKHNEPAKINSVTTSTALYGRLVVAHPAAEPCRHGLRLFQQVQER